ncbi:hypothetical protein ACLOJK_027229 [Asimina triloba]
MTWRRGGRKRRKKREEQREKDSSKEGFCSLRLLGLEEAVDQRWGRRHATVDLDQSLASSEIYKSEIRHCRRDEKVATCYNQVTSDWKDCLWQFAYYRRLDRCYIWIGSMEERRRSSNLKRKTCQSCCHDLPLITPDLLLIRRQHDLSQQEDATVSKGLPESMATRFSAWLIGEEEVTIVHYVISRI